MVIPDMPAHCWCPPRMKCIRCPNSWKKVWTSANSISPGSSPEGMGKLQTSAASGICLPSMPSSTGTMFACVYVEIEAPDLAAAVEHVVNVNRRVPRGRAHFLLKLDLEQLLRGVENCLFGLCVREISADRSRIEVIARAANQLGVVARLVGFQPASTGVGLAFFRQEHLIFAVRD